MVVQGDQCIYLDEVVLVVVEQFVIDVWVLVYDYQFFFVEFVLFEQNCVGDGDFVYVVQWGGYFDQFDFFFGKFQLFGNQIGYMGYVFQIGIGVCIMEFNGMCQL